MSNANLNNALKNKNDEFYTMYEDIEKEMKYYTRFFEGKTIYCNCDNPHYSNFVKYFMDNFDRLKLKRVISTCKHTKGFRYQYDNENRGIFFDSSIHDYNHIKWNLMYPPVLEGDGDFRSEECLKYLQEADIVITNPPFSLWREYVLLLEKYNKKYIILGNINTLFNKDIVPLIYHKKMWEGVSIKKGGIKFYMPDYYCVKEDYPIDDTGKKYVEISCIRWFTNIHHGQPNTGIHLEKEYEPSKYPKYDNTDIINVDRISDIPDNYYGIMGVPVTYFDKHNPKQFDIVGFACGFNVDMLHCLPIIDGKFKYKRILIKRIT